ncbi:GGDEF domain-containing protein [Thalassotalea agariperforans]
MQKNWWEKFISLESSESVDIKRKQLVLNTCSYIGGTIILYFGVQTSFEQQFLLKLALFFSAAFLYGNVLLSYLHKKKQLAITICGLGIIPLVFAIVYTGGYENTGLYWTYPFPITIFVFFGYYRGLLLNIFMFLVIWLMLANPELIDANYRPEEISRYVASYIVNILFCLINEFFRSRSHEELAEINFDKQRQANSDVLTDLPNRRFIDSVFFQASKSEPKAYFPMTLLLLDIDHFKKVNDQYGHDVGDKVLTHFADVLKQHTRATDVVARTGGEEFIIAFPKTEITPGLKIAEKLRETVSESHFQEETKKQSLDIRITVSLGGVCVERYEDIETGLKQADDLLYQAKANGRNRLEHQIAK